MLMHTIEVSKMVALSLAEDLGSGDLSAQLLSPSEQCTAQVIAREPAVICGVDWATEVFRQIDPNIQLDWLIGDGEWVQAQVPFLRIRGCACSVLSGERCALNWLQTLSGTATVTAAYVKQLDGLSVQLLDTRKTIPGLRYAQKYAVRCGGGQNHRMGLYDAYLIKENHIMSCGSITAAILQARQQQPHQEVEVEVESLAELEQALAADVDIILLDNFTLEQMRQAVILNQGRAQLEVSGNVCLDTIKEIAATGVDRISVGALTKHVHAIDLSMRFLEEAE